MTLTEWYISSRKLFNYIKYKSRSEEDAQDIIQNMALLVLETSKQYNPKILADWQVINFYRSQKKFYKLLDKSYEINYDYSILLSSFNEKLSEAFDHRDKYDSKGRRLSQSVLDKDKEIFIKRYLEEKSNREVAVEMRLPERHIRDKAYNIYNDTIEELKFIYGVGNV